MNKREARERLLAGIAMIPSHMRDGVEQHVERGRETGGFLTCLLVGNLEEAYGRADGTNKVFWSDWKRFLADYYLPAECHGSPEKVKAWRAHRGLSGLPDGEG